MGLAWAVASRDGFVDGDSLGRGIWTYGECCKVVADEIFDRAGVESVGVDVCCDRSVRRRYASSPVGSSGMSARSWDDVSWCAWSSILRAGTERN